MAKALVIEPNVALHRQITSALRDEGIAVELVSKPARARAKVLSSMPDVVLLDILLPNLDGLDLARLLKESVPDLPIILLTAGSTSPSVERKAQKVGASVFSTKPFNADRFVRRIRSIIRNRLAKQFPEGLTPAFQSLTAHLLPDLNDPATGRLDAKRIANHLAIPLSSLAEAIGRSDSAVHKSPAAPSLQELLVPIARSLVILSRLLRQREHVLAWLNSPHPDLGSRTPLSLILSGKASTVAQMLEAALAGQLS